MISSIQYFSIMGWLLLTILSAIIGMMWKPFVHEFKKVFLKHSEFIKINEDYSLTKITHAKGKGPIIHDKELDGIKTLNAQRMYFDTTSKTFTTFNLGSETEPFDFFSKDNSYAVPLDIDNKGNVTFKTFRAGRGDSELVEGMLMRERLKTKIQQGLFSPEMYLLVIVIIAILVVGYLIFMQGVTLDQIVQSGGLIRA